MTDLSAQIAVSLSESKHKKDANRKVKWLQQAGHTTVSVDPSDL
jgi:predicted CoA-binding protein